tara:strand:- start:164 stop:484 length:321 start_codon:yes stop_codon:yes gene_type:complete
MYYWVLYAMFMFHPENELHWRITDQLKFKTFVECESYYRKYTDGLYEGLKDYMTANHGAPDLGKYTLMEMGCSMAKNQTPELESRIPLHTMPDLEKFLESKKKIDV